MTGLERVTTAIDLDDRGLRRQIHNQLVGLVNTIDAASRAHEDDYEGQARLVQIIDMLIRDLRLVRADAAERCATHFPVYESGKVAGKPMGKTLIDGLGEVRRSAGGKWVDLDWQAIRSAILARAAIDPETGEMFGPNVSAGRAFEMTLACTGQSSIRVAGVEALGLKMEDVARRDDARPTVSVPSLGDWDVR